MSTAFLKIIALVLLSNPGKLWAYYMRMKLRSGREFLMSLEIIDDILYCICAVYHFENKLFLMEIS